MDTEELRRRRQRTGAFLRYLRDVSGASQAEVAQALGVTVGAVSQWEKGLTDLRPEQLWSLAQFHELNFGDFLEGTGYPVQGTGLTMDEWQAKQRERRLGQPSHSATAARLTPDAPGAPMRGSELPPTSRKPMLWGSSRPLAAAGLA